MAEMGETRYEVTLTLGSWLYLVGLAGWCGGFVVGVLAAGMAAFRGEWWEVFLVLLLAAPFGAVSTIVYAVLGYPLYKYLSAKTPGARTLTGMFRNASDARVGNAP